MIVTSWSMRLVDFGRRFIECEGDGCPGLQELCQKKIVPGEGLLRSVRRKVAVGTDKKGQMERSISRFSKSLYLGA
jgi:hypothetical protein